MRVVEAGGVEHGAARASKCASDSAPRKSISFGAASIDLLHRRILAVEDAQRIGVQAALRVFVEQRRRAASKYAISAARCARALGGLAEAVELEADVAAVVEAEVAQQRARTSGSARRRRPGPAKPSASTSIWWNWR